ncbi:MAG: hypothetical protein GX030_03110 [Firmicutes bacterium]|nr:hypothetical protein [Bacillota bacterium]
MKQPKPRIFRSANTKFTSFAPPEGCRLAMTQVRIDNSNECQFCLRIDIGSRTRFLAYLGRGDLVSNHKQIDVKLPRPIIGQPGESITIDVSDQLPITITITGYEMPADAVGF